MRLPPYSPIIRLTHALIAAAIIFQLASSQFMDHPRAKRPMTADGGMIYHWHEWIGLASLAVLLWAWAYRVMHWKREPGASLFPWIAAGGRAALWRETRQFIQLRWTTIPDTGALAGTVHGLGMLIASAMAISGGVIYLLLGPNDALTPAAHEVMEVHQFLANFMWVYLGGHAIMAFWHQYLGHKSLARIFKI